MDMLHVDYRTNSKNEKSKKIRRNGLIPGIIYSKEFGNFMFEIGELELNNYISHEGEHGIVDIDINGNNVKTLIKEVQKEPINHKIIHIDLQQVSDKECLQSDIPIIFENENSLLRKKIVALKFKDNIKVKCSVNDLPKNIKVDLSKLDIDIKNSLKVKDLNLPNNIMTLDDPESTIVSIVESNTKFINQESEETDEIEETIE